MVLSPAFLGTLAGDLIWLDMRGSYQSSLLLFSLLIIILGIAADTKYCGLLVWVFFFGGGV